MSRDYLLFLKDILDASARVAAYTRGLDFDAFEGDNQLVDATLFNLMTIGEAAKNVPENIRAKHPQVPWREVGRFRDLVAHHYFGIDLKIVWGIVRNNLPALAVQVRAVLEAESS